MTRQLFTAFALLFTHLFQPSIANTSGMGPVRIADVATPSRAGAVTEVPFTIDTSEVEGAEIIYTGEQSFPATASGTLTVDIESLYYDAVYLFNANNSVVAKDVIHPDIKMSLEFNAANSARAEVFEALSLTVLPYAELGKLYGEIDQQKRFPELISIYRTDRRMRNDMKTIRLAILIADTLATSYLD